MRVAFHNLEGWGLSWARRLVDEGNDVLMYHASKDHREVGMGLVRIEGNYDKWVAWGKQNPATIFFFDCSGAGEKAELLRQQGCLVIGSGKLQDRAEKERAWFMAACDEMGMKTPPTKEFATISGVIAFLESDPEQEDENADGGWAWKSEKYLEAAATFVGADTQAVLRYLSFARERFGDATKCILQEKIKGAALSTAQWFDGKRFVGPVEGTQEHKAFLDGDLGPATGCACNVVWFYDSKHPVVCDRLNWSAFEAWLVKQKAGPGIYDLNAIITKDAAYVLEATFRLGSDSEMTSQRAIKSLSALLAHLVGTPRWPEAEDYETVDDIFDTSQIYCSVRVSVPPYPTEAKQVSEMTVAQGTPIYGADGCWAKQFVVYDVRRGTYAPLEVASPFGMVGISLSAGKSLQAAFNRCYAYLDKKNPKGLKVANMQYRTDAAKVLGKDIEEYMSLGLDMPRGIVWKVN